MASCMEHLLKQTLLHTTLFALTLPMSLYALGLGDMKVKSSLDQPFNAEIELIDANKKSLKGIKVGLAEPHSYEEIGIEVLPVLSLLEFTIEVNNQDKLVIKIKSQERMTEPYMQMVVDMAWPTGQLYKVYTVLLDPPGYQLINSTSVGGATYYHKSTQHSKTTGVVEKEVITDGGQNKTIKPNGRKGASTYGPTISNENVWQISQRYKTFDATLPQIVLGIVGANPEAFQDENLNGLKVGVSLNIPSSDDIQKVSSELATQEVMAHDNAWNNKSPINHVIAPPYISGAQPASETAYISKLPGIPALKLSSVNVVNSANGVLLQNSKISQIKLPHSNEQDLTTQAQLSITAAAVDSMRATNDVLLEQLRDLRSQNAKLQSQLDKREKDIESIRAQLQVMMKERKSVASQATAAQDVVYSSATWPLVLFLLAIAAGGGYAYWYFIIRSREEEQSEKLAEVTPELKPLDMEPTKIEDIPTAPEMITISTLETSEKVVPDDSEPEIKKMNDSSVENLTDVVSRDVEFDNEAPLIERVDTPAENKPAKEEINIEEQSPNNEPMEFEAGLHQQLSEQNDTNHEARESNTLDVPEQKLNETEEEKPLKLIKSQKALDTLLALAKTYISMDDFESAKHSLNEVAQYGSEDQKQVALELLEQIKDK